MTTPLRLLDVDEPAVFEIFNAAGSSNVVLVCDHASNRVPRYLNNLGLNAQELADHISWDPGAADVARLVSVDLNAPLLLSSYSRLVIDCNRPLQSPELIAEQSAGTTVPGNRNLSPNERSNRIEGFFQPYHQAIETLLNQRQNRINVLLSIHSFTPVLNGKQRPWHIGVSYKQDHRFAALLYDALEQVGDITVGYNQPYPIEDTSDYTLPTHGEKRGIPSVMIEIRQNEIATPENTIAWAKRLTRAYRVIEADLLLTL